MTASDDGHLIEQVRAGDGRAFEALYEKYKAPVFRAALAITGDPAAAEDILQECFLRLHAHVDRLDGSQPLSPWLHRVAVNLAYNFVARRRRTQHLLRTLWQGRADRSTPSFEAVAERADLSQRLNVALNHLSLEHRLVVVLFYLSEFSLEEIAYILDCPVGTVKSRLYYARQKLRAELLGDRQGEPESLYGLARSPA